MDEYGEIQFVERNANEHDHRRTGNSRTNGGRTFIAQPQHRYPQQYPQQYPGQYPQQPQVVYASAAGMGVGIGGGSGVFGRMSTGQVIDMVAQIFAALMPLPAGPTATADVSTDVGNLMLYQGSLAQYAKRDEQIRTLGNLVTKLVG
ncbi:MAG: hypothetical protein NT062_10970 [Proteobacteria bacterium]|nr:hypothetical protein [Pseudomonadota bacterium]